jgi:peptidoglycan hydrolase CwlO-like protein
LQNEINELVEKIEKGKVEVLRLEQEVENIEKNIKY